MDHHSPLPPTILHSVLETAFEASIISFSQQHKVHISLGQEQILRSEALSIVKNTLVQQSNYCLNTIQGSMDKVVSILLEDT